MGNALEIMVFRWLTLVFGAGAVFMWGSDGFGILAFLAIIFAIAACWRDPYEAM